MAFIPVPDSVYAVMGYTDGVQTWSNGLWFRKENFSNTDMTTLAAWLALNIGQEMRGQLCVGVSYSSCTLYDMRSEQGLVVVDTSRAGAGSQGGDYLPLNVALCLTLRTAIRGRSGRGRLYLAGFPDGYIVDGQFEAIPVTSIRNIYTDVLAGVGAQGWEWVVCSRYTQGQARTAGVTYAVTAVESRSTVPTTQRRRLDRS